MTSATQDRPEASAASHPLASKRSGRFPDWERSLLLGQPRIGPKVIEQLEAAGFASLDALRSAGVDKAVEVVCSLLGTVAWANRRRALSRALDTIPHGPNRVTA